MLFSPEDQGMQVQPPNAALNALRTVSPRLGMKLVAAMGGAYWAVTEKWKLSDKRRERIQLGEIPADADFDVITTFPPSMRAEDVVNWTDRHYGDRVMDDAASEAEAERQLLARMQADLDTRKSRLDKFLDDSEQKVKDDSSHQRRLAAGPQYGETVTPMVAGFGDAPKRTTDKPPKKSPKAAPVAAE